MHCPVCETLNRVNDGDHKARVIKTQTSRHLTHRIYRCLHPDCEHTFHTIEITRNRLQKLQDIESRAQEFARAVHD